MTIAPQKQADFAFAKGLNHQPAQEASPVRAEFAPRDVIASPKLTEYGELEKQAKNLVGTTFYATLLKQMHDSPFKSDLFSGGRGGEAFNSMYDQHLATAMAQRSGDKLARPIIKRYKALAKTAYEKQKQQSAEAKSQQDSSNVTHDRRA
ncbi:MAG: rod-binding protein [Tepidisphaeraceae bacterium]